MSAAFKKSVGSFAQAVGAAALTVLWPNHAKNDIGLLFVETSGADTITTPSGWTQVSGSPLADVADSTGSNVHIFWKRAESSSESNISITDSGDHKIGLIVTYGGCITAGDPINAIASSAKSTASTVATCPSVTTTVKNCLVVLFASIPTANFTNNFGTFSNSALSDIAEDFNSFSSSGDDGSFCVANGVKGSIGPTGTSTSTITFSQSLTNVTFTIALSPAPNPVFFAKGGDFLSSTSANWPSGHKVDDIGLLVIECSGDGSTLTPSGWTHVTGSPLADVATTSGSLLQVLWKRATSSAESSVTIGDSGNHQLGAIYVYRGCVTSGNPWDAIAAVAKATASTVATCPTVTTTELDTLAVLICTIPTAIGTAFGDFANTSLSSITDRGEVAFTIGNGGNIVVADGVKSTIGEIFESTTTCTNGTNVAFTIALKPPIPLEIGVSGKSRNTERTKGAIFTSVAAIGGKSRAVQRTPNAILRNGPTISVSGKSTYVGRTLSVIPTIGINFSGKSITSERTLSATFTTGLERPVEGKSRIIERTKGASAIISISNQGKSRIVERTRSAKLRSIFSINSEFTGFAAVLDATVEEHVPNTGNFTGYAAVLEAYGGAVGEFTGFAAVLDATAEGTNDIYGDFTGFASVLDATVNEKGTINANFTGFASVIEAYGGAVGEFTGFASVLSSDVGEIGTINASFTGFASVLSGTSIERNLINAEFTGFAATGGNDVNGSFCGFAAVLSGSVVQEVEGVINVNLNGAATVMNTFTGEVTRYTNFNFMHLIPVGNKLYGVRTNGFYEISPDIGTDNGDEIIGKVVTKTTDFGTYNLKAVTYCYLNSDSEITITPTADDIVGHSHNTSFGGRKCHLSRGLKGRYFSFEISGIKQLEGLELLENNSQKRIKY